MSKTLEWVCMCSIARSMIIIGKLSCIGHFQEKVGLLLIIFLSEVWNLSYSKFQLVPPLLSKHINTIFLSEFHFQIWKKKGIGLILEPWRDCSFSCIIIYRPNVNIQCRIHIYPVSLTGANLLICRLLILGVLMLWAPRI